jgi:hypothetical protein
MKTMKLIIAFLLFSNIGLFPQSTKTCNLTLFLEGLYIGSNTLRPAMNGSGYQWGATIADKITIELYDAPAYSGVVYTANDIALNTDGTTTFTLPDTYNNSYYITIKQRNHIQTSTKLPISFLSSTISYNFDAPGKSYGNNMKLLLDGTAVIYGGDENCKYP